MAFPLIKHILQKQELPSSQKRKADIKLIKDNIGESLVLDEDEIDTALSKMEKNHALLTVELNDNKNICSSLILEINTRENYLVIDEFYPSSINNEIELGNSVDISCNHSGSYLRFVSKIIDKAEVNGNPYYKIPYPDVIEYSQRRQSYRVPISLSNPIKVSFTSQNNNAAHGVIRDISFGGFCARLTPPLNERFKPDDYIPKCVIQLPGNGVIVCSIEVRRIFLSTSTGIPMMGCRFVQMNPADKKTLQQSVTKLERDLMKKIKR